MLSGQDISKTKFGLLNALQSVLQMHANAKGAGQLMSSYIVH